ncbi:ankyrin repeat-containing domain protein, partial [Elsinoe ampelina]
VVRILLLAGALIDVKDSEGGTPLANAVYMGHVEIVRMLLERGADVNVRQKYNITPLMQSAIAGKAELVSLLLSYGAELEAYHSTTFTTALSIASRRGDLPLVELLLKSGASIKSLACGEELAIIFACAEGKTNVLPALLDH